MTLHSNGGRSDAAAERLAEHACWRANAQYDAAAEHVTVTQFDRFVYDGGVGPTSQRQVLRYECRAAGGSQNRGHGGI